MAWDDNLESPHRESPHLITHGLVSLPTGTGKTGLGLMRRVVRLLEQEVPGDRILLLSFTRVAAADLRDKVAALAAPGVDAVRATTLHGYCFRLLQQESVLAITGRVPRILLEHEVALMLRDIGGDFGTIHQRRRLLEAFVAGWARGDQDYPGVAGSSEERSFEHSVMSWLRTHKAMLIGEVVPQAYQFLRSNPQAPALRAYEHVIVDEYQDLNILEQRLLDTLAANCALCVAGDDDQSIYSVRYANPEGILKFLDRDDVEKQYAYGVWTLPGEHHRRGERTDSQCTRAEKRRPEGKGLDGLSNNSYRPMAGCGCRGGRDSCRDCGRCFVKSQGTGSDSRSNELAENWRADSNTFGRAEYSDEIIFHRRGGQL